MFLEILTRCMPGRENMRQRNRLSLIEQTDDDWSQTILFDDDCAGIPAAQVRLADYADKLVGDYIWILDDDDLCTRPSLVAELKQITADHDYDVIIVKMDHGPRGILPYNSAWGREPRIGEIGSSGYIVSRQLWQDHADAFRGAHYCSDFDFIASVWNHAPSVYWHDVIASQVQMIGRGQKETA